MSLQRGGLARNALAALSFALALGVAIPAGTNAQTQEEKPYKVKDGKVDRAAYNGWRRYTESCLRCHGPDGAGSSYAPDLVESLSFIMAERRQGLASPTGTDDTSHHTSAGILSSIKRFFGL